MNSAETTIDDFYDPDLYDRAVGDAITDDPLVAYYVSKVGDRRRVLDIGSGTGRLAVPLLQDGREVVCIDRSERMLAAFQKKLARESPAAIGAVSVHNIAFGPRVVDAPVEVAFAIDDFLLHLMSVVELCTFFHDLTSWLVPGGHFVTDIRPRRSEDLMAQSTSSVGVRTFGVSASEAHETQYAMVYWEQYDPNSRHLVTTCQYQTLTSSGEVLRTKYRRLQQRVHANADLIACASDNGFKLVRHCAREDESVAPKTDIGGTFEFCLAP